MVDDKAARLIRLAREDIGMSQAELAAAARLQQPTISAYESGTKRPRADTVARILAAARMRPSVPLSVFADEIVAAARSHGLSEVRVFGSAVRGTDTAGSDIDLIVRPGLTTTLFDLGAFSAEVTDLTGFAVDVLTDAQIDNEFFRHAGEEAVPL